MPSKPSTTAPVPAAVANPFTIGEVLDAYDKPTNREPNAYDAVIKSLMDANKPAVRLTIAKDALDKAKRGFQLAAHRVDRSASFSSESEGPAGVVGVLSLGARRTRTTADDSAAADAAPVAE